MPELGRDEYIGALESSEPEFDIDAGIQSRAGTKQKDARWHSKPSNSAQVTRRSEVLHALYHPDGVGRDIKRIATVPQDRSSEDGKGNNFRVEETGSLKALRQTRGGQQTPLSSASNSCEILKVENAQRKRREFEARFPLLEHTFSKTNDSVSPPANEEEAFQNSFQGPSTTISSPTDSKTKAILDWEKRQLVAWQFTEQKMTRRENLAWRKRTLEKIIAADEFEEAARTRQLGVSKRHQKLLGVEAEEDRTKLETVAAKDDQEDKNEPKPFVRSPSPPANLDGDSAEKWYSSLMVKLEGK